jgi:hypothetical protein
MIACAAARIAGYHHNGLEDDSWNFFWQHAEGAVAVMMASITAFRTLFVKPSENHDAVAAATAPSPGGSWLQRVFARFQTLARAEPEKMESEGPQMSSLKLRKMPGPLLYTVRSFIRKNNRTGSGTENFDTLGSEVSTVDKESVASEGVV